MLYNASHVGTGQVKIDMKRALKLGTVIVLFWNVFVFAQAPPSTERKPDQATASMGPMEVTTDTQGVDFGPYLQRVIHDIKRNWYNLIPESAMPPLLKKGKLSIEFAITKNGQIAALRYVSSSGDVAFDRAAYGGITASNPFLPLPTEFHGQYLGVRFTFFYNPWLSGISPSGARVRAGSSLQLSPLLKGNTERTDSAITWTVLGRGCTESICGTISNDGLCTAPLTVPENRTITVKATAPADLGETVSAAVTIVPADASTQPAQ